MLSDCTRTTTFRSQEQLPLPMDDGPEMDRGLPAVLRQRDRWVSPATERRIEEAWGPRGPRQICQVCQIGCPLHRALRLHVDTHFLLHFCPCGFHDVFSYPMKCHISYLIADFENFSPDTLKMANILCCDVRYGKCE